MSEGTELWAVGGLRVVEKAFGQTIQDNAVYLPGVMSRKKQVVPPISRVI
jgi:manganese-dependent inorganic pyrophosphatase